METQNQIETAYQILSHQQTVMDFMKTNSGLIVMHDTGLGKTLTSIMVAIQHLDDYVDDIVFFVTTKSVQDNFKREFKKFDVKIDQDDERIKFFTYQSFYNNFEDKKFPKNSLLIIDEAHNLRTEIVIGGDKKIVGGKRSYKMLYCTRLARKVLLLTATTIYNKPEDIFNLVSYVKKTPLPSEKERYKILNDEKQFQTYFSCIISYQPKKYSIDFPIKAEHLVEITMTQDYYNAYMEVEDGTDPRYIEKNPLVFLSGLRQATNKIYSCPKCDWILKKLNENKPTVIFSSFKTYGIKLIQSTLEKENTTFESIDGTKTMSQRMRSVDNYNNGLTKILFITKAGGEGLDLKNTRYVIIMESLWNRPSMEQVIGRAIRYKSHESVDAEDRIVDIYHLLLVKPELRRYKNSEHKSADEILCNLMLKKEKTNEKFLSRLRKICIEKNVECWK